VRGALATSLETEACAGRTSTSGSAQVVAISPAIASPLLGFR
jgi:hypothetical protein